MKNKFRPIENYLVTWTIDIEASSPEQAARMAFEIMQEKGTAATVFFVKDKETNKKVTIDLEHEG